MATAETKPTISTLKDTKVVGPPSPVALRGEQLKQYTLADVDPIGRTEVIIYGAPKAGKGVLASSFPPPFRWLAADGTTCLKSVRWAMMAGKSSIKNAATDLVAYTPHEDADKGVYPSKATAYNKMVEMIQFWFSPGEVEKWEGGTLVLDSATEISEWTLNFGLDLNGQLPKPEKPLSTSHALNVRAKARIISGQQDYKSAMALFEGFLSDVRVECARHNRNLVVICHEWTEDREADDGTTTIVRYRPLLIGQLRERVPKSFDDIWHVEMMNGKEVRLSVHGDPRHVAGTRWGQVPDLAKDPDYRRMIEKVRAFHGIK